MHGTHLKIKRWFGYFCIAGIVDHGKSFVTSKLTYTAQVFHRG